MNERIEDMAPGTTFTAQYRMPEAVDQRFSVVGSGFWVRGETGLWDVASGIDRSTIRDVTPPPEH